MILHCTGKRNDVAKELISAAYALMCAIIVSRRRRGHFQSSGLGLDDL
jgi:hypothetical protein